MNGTLLDFHPSNKSGRTTQQEHTETKLRGKLADIEIFVKSFFDSRTMKFDYLSIPTDIVFVS
jgi:hypothetical protein